MTTDEIFAPLDQLIDAVEKVMYTLESIVSGLDSARESLNAEVEKLMKGTDDEG